MEINIRKHLRELIEVLSRTFVSMIPIIVFARVESAIKTMYILYLMMVVSYILKHDMPLRWRILTIPAILSSVAFVACKSWGIFSFLLSNYAAKVILAFIIVWLPLFLCLLSNTGYELAIAFQYVLLAYLTFVIIYPSILGEERILRFFTFLYHMLLILLLTVTLYIFSMFIKKKEFKI